MNPVDTPSAVRKVLRLPDLVLCIAERLPDQDRVNLAATNHALRAIIDDRIALWKVPSDHTTRPGQVARVNWRDAWSERANRAQPALRTALEKSLLSRPGDASRVGGQHLEVPDIFSAPYTGLEHLVCRARHFARRIGSETAPYTAPLGRYIEQRDLNVAAACRLGASIGLDLSQLETDLSKLEAH
ncbi:MAG TPA: F-box protein, partial [Myxococcota bacterium]|nr:F-box protein [Myxococcota bacterium]